MTRGLPGVIPSPNIWDHPEVYEIENLAVDPDHAIEAAMRSVRDWSGSTVLDIGCGTGFHLPRFAESAARVIGIEPHARLYQQAERRVAGLANVDVGQGVASRLPIPEASIDVAHARWSYFFGPGCEPGLAELDRVMRRGGAGFIIDNDTTRSTFGCWFRSGYPTVRGSEVESFLSGRGWARHSLQIRWLFATRADFESVVRIEFAPDLAGRIIDEHEGVEVDYAVNLWSKAF